MHCQQRPGGRMKIRVLLADDHQLFREALRMMLESEAAMEVVAQTGDGLEVVKLARATHPDIVCMDIGLPGMNGIETTRRLLAACPEVKVIGLSAFYDQRYVADMLGAGAVGYVTKAAASAELLRAVKVVHLGQKYMCPEAAAALAPDQPSQTGQQETGGAASLGARERQVLQLIAEGHTSPQISIRLHIAPSTVDVHRRNIMRKLDLHSVADLTRFAIRNGLTAS